MILDHKGNPISPKGMKGEQAVQTWTRSYAMLAPLSAQTPERIASILRQAASGDMYSQALLFADMEEKDPHIFAEMQKRKGGVSGLGWSVQPWDDSELQKRMAGEASAVLEALGAANLFFSLADAFGKGVSAVEMTWDMRCGMFAPVRASQRPLGWFQWRVDNLMATDELGLANMTLNAEPLIPGKWIVHVQPGGNGNPFRAALYRNIVWLYLFRNYTVKSWAQFLEIYGIPFRIGKFPAGAGQDEKDSLLAALGGMFADSVVAIPDTTDIKLEAVSGGKSSEGAHQKFMDWSAKEISKAILGATLTSDSDGKGSYAMAEVHNEVRMDILEMDARGISETINRDLIRPFIALNWGEQEQYPYLQFSMPENGKREQTANMLKLLSEIGFRDVPVWWIHEIFGIPTPEEGDKTLAEARPDQAVPPQMKTPEQNRAARVQATAEDQELDTMLQPVMDLVRTAGSFEDIADRLYDIFPDMDPARFQRLIARAMFAAGLWGAAS